MKSIKYLLTVFMLAGLCFAQAGKTSDPGLDSALASYYRNELDKAASLFEKIIEDDPGNINALNYYAETNRRLEEWEEAESAAKEALRISPCNSLALSTLGDLYSPQYGSWEKANYDTAWSYLMKSIECNPKEDNAWLGIWIIGQRRGDSVMENRALKELYDSRFFPDPVLEYNRWVLKSMPKDAILLTYGDLDTYPALSLQAAEKLRTDVTLINFNMMNMFWYADTLCRRSKIPLPYTAEEADTVSPRYSDDSSYIKYIACDIVENWRRLIVNGELKRPLVFASTMDRNYMPDRSVLRKLGPAYVYEPTQENNKIDLGAYFRASEFLSGEKFRGDIVSKNDRSPVRHTSDKDGFRNNVIFAYLSCSHTLFEQGKIDDARKLLEWLTRFAQDAEAGDKIKNEIIRLKNLMNRM